MRYARSTLQELLDWYRSADAKAQVALSLDGAYLAFLTSVALGDPVTRQVALQRFGPETWGFVAGLALTLALSVLSALACLRSRTYSPRALRAHLRRTGVDPEDEGTYGPRVLQFFQTIAALDPGRVVKRLARVDAGFELEAFAWRIAELSRNVVQKHAWANRAFLLGGSSLVMLLGALASYVVRVR